jgi:hypothetical protein
VGALTSHNSVDLHGPLRRYLYFFLKLFYFNTLIAARGGQGSSVGIAMDCWLYGWGLIRGKGKIFLFLASDPADTGDNIFGVKAAGP